MTPQRKGRYSPAKQLAVIFFAAVYLFIFFFRTLSFYNVPGPALKIGLSLIISLALAASAIYHPMPLKIRAVIVMYIILFGVLSDIVNLLLEAFFPGLFFWKLLYRSGILVVAVSAYMIIFGYIHGKRIKTQRYAIRTKKKIPKKTLKIALVSDIHMDKQMRQKLQGICDEITREKPDLFLIAGDLCDDETLPEDMLFACRAMASVKSTYGTYFVYGNHDLGAHGPELRYSYEALIRELREVGIHILNDECTELNGITIIGRRDAWLARVSGGRKPLSELTENVKEDNYIILMDHQPIETKIAAKEGIDLQVSGHTHGGQIWPAGLIPASDVIHGLRTNGSYNIVVSSGLGFRGAALRSGCTAEVVMIDVIGG